MCTRLTQEPGDFHLFPCLLKESSTILVSLPLATRPTVSIVKSGIERKTAMKLRLTVFSGICLFVLVMLTAISLSPVALGQTTISTGSIQGTVTDPSGAVVNGAKVSIRNKATNQTITTSSNSSGAYTSGALTPGDYTVRIEAAGFKTVEIPVAVQVNTTSSGNAR